MINWNDIRVEQEIAQERYQPIIQSRQISRDLAKNGQGQSEMLFFRRVWVGFERKVRDLGVSLRRPQKSTSPQC
jgi:hypothetical protein